MSTLERLDSLTDAVCADPADAQAALVLADYLEEHGDRCAPYLRGQIALRNAKGESERFELQQQLRALYPSTRATWLGRLEQAGVLEANLTRQPFAWWGQELPGRSSGGTYTRYGLSDLPPVPVDQLDGSLGWLRDTPVTPGSPADPCDPALWERLMSTLEDIGFRLPPALRVLMTDTTLQKAIPSATANYFIAAEPEQIDPHQLQDIVPEVAFLPFYSDQQCCVRWGLWLERSGGAYAPVMAAGIDWGDEEDEDYDDESMRYVGFQFAAPNLESFLYRTWIENRLWFATVYSDTLRDPLDFEREYLRAYGGE